MLTPAGWKPGSGLRTLKSALVALALTLGGGLAVPAAATERWVSVGPVGGMIRLLAQAPSDPERLYAATERFGVYRSRDGGLSWRSVRGNLEGSTILALAVAPSDSEVLLATTYGGSPRRPLWRSQDGGASWVPAVRPPKHGHTFLFPYGFVFAPGSAQTVYAGTERGVFRSLDGGSTWDSWALPDLVVFALARDGRTPTTWFVAGRGFDDFHGAIYRSDDDGTTWRETPSAGGPGFGDPPVRLFFRAGALYAQWAGALYRSTDGAATWSLAAGLPDVYAVELDFSPSGSIYAATDAGVYSSTDGTHWSPPIVTSIDQASPRDATSQLAFLSEAGAGETVIATGRRGVWRSTDRGGSWQAASRGIAAHDVHRLTVIPNPQGTVIGSFEDDLYRIDRAGDKWQRLPRHAGFEEFPVLAADPHHPGRIYALGESAVDVSEDRGNSWRPAGVLGHNNITLLKVDPVHPGVLYAGVTHGQASSENPFGYRSIDGGATWTEFLPFEWLLDVVFDPARPSLGFLVTQIGLYKSTDGGSSWAPLPNLTDQLLGSFPSSILIDSRSGALYVGTEERGIFRSTDSGRTFRRVAAGLPRVSGGRNPSVSSLVQDAAGDIYAGLYYAGVFRLVPGQGWQAVNLDLPVETFAGTLVADPARPGLLYAGSLGSSVLKLEDR
ncbi:MAG TPA: hypothetical protein VGS22_08210 [Thermoanaerobaculia bacterium]|jgi:photosystem II stability/assembly factor-like uncharacterized protein|nr:hypothetical protein [Thermoanaerobaculia bacterium]